MFVLYTTHPYPVAAGEGARKTAALGGTLQGRHLRGKRIATCFHKFIFIFRLLSYSEEEEASMQ